MTYQNDCALPEDILEKLISEGLDALPNMIWIINQALKLDRQKHLAAGRYELTLSRRGLAMGFKAFAIRNGCGMMF